MVMIAMTVGAHKIKIMGQKGLSVPSEAKANETSVAQIQEGECST